MSRASEWCDSISRRLTPEDDAPVFLHYDLRLHRPAIVATVQWHSNLSLSEAVLDRRRALDLARWILATFGDAPDDQMGSR